MGESSHVWVIILSSAYNDDFGAALDTNICPTPSAVNMEVMIGIFEAIQPPVEDVHREMGAVVEQCPARIMSSLQVSMEPLQAWLRLCDQGKVEGVYGPL